ncbi:MAG: type 1 glutamine amidotransferase, partial [Cyanobacteria bacterium J06642_11]
MELPVFAIAMKILVIQNSVRDPIGILGEHLTDQGAELVTWLPEQQPQQPQGEFSGLIILGGHMNAHEDDKYPHLKQVVELIQQFHAEDKPIMGVCLGSQLIARAFGSQVYPHSTPELGFSPLRVIEPVATESWLKDCPTDLHIMQWHFDTFDLPVQATLLMTNHFCKHQAYRIGTNIYGFQFHLEVTPEIITDWLTAKSD